MKLPVANGYNSARGRRARLSSMQCKKARVLADQLLPTPKDQLERIREAIRQSCYRGIRD
jgi:hypothetical protein